MHRNDIPFVTLFCHTGEAAVPGKRVASGIDRRTIQKRVSS